MAQRKTLTLAQIEILRWVQDGCRGEERNDNGRRVSVAALRNRGLVTTTGHGDSWGAAITDDGVAYLAKVDGDDPPTPRESASVTEQLVADIVAAGGTLEVQSRSYRQRHLPDYEQRALAAMRHGRVPDGKRLLVRHVHDGNLELSLVDGPAAVANLDVITVPDRVSRYNAVGRFVRDSYDQLGLSRSVASRAARIMHTLAAAAEEREFTVAAPEVVVHRYPSYRSNTPTSFTFRKGSCSLELRLSESSKEPGRLDLEFPGWRSGGRQARWGDRRRWRLEDKLTDVLREMLVRVAEHEEREAGRKREAEQRRIAWEEAMVVARRRHAEASRAKVLLDEVDRWEMACRVRAYVAAVDDRFAEDRDAAAWSAWALEYAAGLDPLSSSVRLPPAPEDPRPEELRPFLGRWSPWGPDAR